MFICIKLTCKKRLNHRRILSIKSNARTQTNEKTDLRLSRQQQKNVNCHRYHDEISNWTITTTRKTAWYAVICYLWRKFPVNLKQSKYQMNKNYSLYIELDELERNWINMIMWNIYIRIPELKRCCFFVKYILFRSWS